MHFTFKNKVTLREIEAVSTQANSIEFSWCSGEDEMENASIIEAISKMDHLTALKFSGFNFEADPTKRI